MSIPFVLVEAPARTCSRSENYFVYAVFCYGESIPKPCYFDALECIGREFRV